MGPDPRPSPLAKAGGVWFRPGLPPPPRRAAAGPAGCWREEGRSRAPRPARPRGRWQALGSVVSARDRLDFALVCFIGSNRKIKKKFFLIYYQSNKDLDAFRAAAGPRLARRALPHRLLLLHLPLQKCEPGSRVCGREPRVRPPSPDSAGLPAGLAGARISAAREGEWLVREPGPSSPASGGECWW